MLGDEKRAFAHFTVLLVVLPGLCAAQAGRVEPVELPSDSSVPQAVRNVLNPKGYRVLLDDGSTACDIWLRKSIPGPVKNTESSVLYPQLAESTLVGVISFLQATTDYRGEPVKAGAYTMRYELMPNDGNHLGVAPNRDFLLLVPADSDPDPNAVMKFEQLVSLSRKATGTQHPAPLSLVQATGGTAAVSKNDEEHWLFSASFKLASGEDLPFSMVVKGTAPQ
ncbi:MAG TPA: hypothetical protein VMT28_04685 [Terriglobales bacterium]|jgi:hypothetical protein|nr:hypothetical protein [Terriglobales bacterium]